VYSRMTNCAKGCKVSAKEAFGGFRARRQCAEQSSPGSQSKKPMRQKGLTVMVKNVFNRISSSYPVALVFSGWLLFGLGVIINAPLWFKLTLLSAARVLP
jgi:hypothetical protein